MLSEYDLIQTEIPNTDEVTVYPIADVHYGALEHNGKEWTAFCRKITEDPSSYLVLCGDLINNNTRSSVGSPWDDTVRPREQKKRMTEMLEPVKNRILCAVTGNHEARSQKDADDDPTYDILCKLDLEDRYRQNAAFVKMNIGKRPHGESNDSTVQSYAIYVTHGSGGGIYTGASVNRVERYSYTLDGVDAVVTGHTHKGSITKPRKLCVDMHHNQILVRDVCCVVCTAWQEFGGFAMRKMLLPSASSSAEHPQTLIFSGMRDKRYIRAIW